MDDAHRNDSDTGDSAPRPDLDSDAMGQTIADCLPQLIAYVRVHTGRELQAKESISDLVQSACREVLRAPPADALTNPDRLRAWLFQAAKQKILEKARYWRAAKRDPQREAAFSLSEDDRKALERAYAAFGTPSGGLRARDEIERLESALAELPEDYREVILLARIVGLPHADIAEAMGRSPEATRKLLARALTELTRHL